MKKLFKLIPKLFFGLVAALILVWTIYWFELDTLAIKKFEPIFRHFANEI